MILPSYAGQEKVLGPTGAPQAAAVIHTDFERGFIKAEIVSFDDLMAAGSMTDAKAAGKVRMEGKEYVMADGDVVVDGAHHVVTWLFARVSAT